MEPARPDSTVPDLSVVVVTRNDEDRVGGLLNELRHALRAVALRSGGAPLVEIMVLDEGSSDNTLAVLALLRRRMPELVVLPGIAGGLGLRRGAELCRGKRMLLLSAADGAAPPATVLSTALASLDDGADVVVAAPALLVRRQRALPLLPALGGGRLRASACAPTLSRLLPAVLRQARGASLAVAELAERSKPVAPRPGLRQPGAALRSAVQSLLRTILPSVIPSAILSSAPRSACPAPAGSVLSLGRLGAEIAALDHPS